MMNGRIEIGLRLCVRAVTTLVALLPMTSFAQSVEGPAFDSDANDTVFALALQADGKIVVGSSFAQIGGHPRNLATQMPPPGFVLTAQGP